MNEFLSFIDDPASGILLEQHKMDKETYFGMSGRPVIAVLTGFPRQQEMALRRVWMHVLFTSGHSGLDS